MNAAAMSRIAIDSALDRAPERDVRTTDGAIALQNLHAQIEALEGRAASSPDFRSARVDLIGLLVLRGQVLGCIADAERAADLAEQAVQKAPTDGLARLARARIRSDDHRFAEALADLDAAEQLGMAAAAVDVERIAILHAVGRSAEALTLGRAAADRRPDFASLAALAVLHAERGETAAAEDLFAASLARYRGVSPFPIAHLDVMRGRMWQRAGDVGRARMWFERAVQRVPGYAPAKGSIGELGAPFGGADDGHATRSGAIIGGGTDDGRENRG